MRGSLSTFPRPSSTCYPLQDNTQHVKIKKVLKITFRRTPNRGWGVSCFPCQNVDLVAPLGENGKNDSLNLDPFGLLFVENFVEERILRVF